MAYTPACQEPKAYGLLDIKIAAPAYTGTTKGALIDLGIAQDQTEIQDRPFFHDIHSDRNGGQYGPPVDVQYLGQVIQISLELTSWNETALNLIRQRAVNQTLGTVAQAEIGKFMLKENSIRLLIDTLDPLNTRNFWCCLAREPISIGMGTRHAAYRLNFTAYRPPCYHQKSGIIEDKDNT